MDEAKKSILNTYAESWEIVDMLFMLPGLIIWIAGAIWCFRKNNIHGAVLLQVLGALEIVIGGITAFIVAMRELASATIDHGGYDPYIMSTDLINYVEIVLIGLITHFVLLALTLMLSVRAKTNISRSHLVT